MGWLGYLHQATDAHGLRDGHLAGAPGLPRATHVRVAALAVDLPKHGKITGMRSEEKGGMEKGFEWDLECGPVAVVPHGHEFLEGLEHVDGRGAGRQGEGSGREREEGRYE